MCLFFAQAIFLLPVPCECRHTASIRSQSGVCLKWRPPCLVTKFLRSLFDIHHSFEYEEVSARPSPTPRPALSASERGLRRQLLVCAREEEGARVAVVPYGAGRHPGVARQVATEEQPDELPLVLASQGGGGARGGVGARGERASVPAMMIGGGGGGGQGARFLGKRRADDSECPPSGRKTTPTPCASPLQYDNLSVTRKLTNRDYLLERSWSETESQRGVFPISHIILATPSTP